MVLREQPRASTVNLRSPNVSRFSGATWSETPVFSESSFKAGTRPGQGLDLHRLVQPLVIFCLGLPLLPGGAVLGRARAAESDQRGRQQRCNQTQSRFHHVKPPNLFLLPARPMAGPKIAFSRECGCSDSFRRRRIECLPNVTGIALLMKAYHGMIATSLPGTRTT